MGNGFPLHGGVPPAAQPWRLPQVAFVPPAPRRLRLALVLFLLTVVSTLFVGLHLARAYAQGQPPYADSIYSFELLRELAANPFVLFQGWAFAATLLGILLAHELGHYFACRHYGIVASYPYFLPFPNLIGTMGAFIRIQSPIVNRRALFDVGIAGPLVGFVLAVPALVWGLANSKALPEAAEGRVVVFGNPLLVWFFEKLFWPGVSADHLMLHPVARAAWVGLFATALNLLPVGQLDGGHIIYAVAAEKHRRLSRTVTLALILIGLPGFLQAMQIIELSDPNVSWPGWFVWGVLLLFLGVRHPTVLDPGAGLDSRRLWVAALGLLVFLLCFTPVPFHNPY